MSLSQTSASTLSPDCTRVSTLGGIWTSRHKERIPVRTRVETARLRMDRLEVESSVAHPDGFRYLGALLLAGGVIDYALWQVAVHSWPHIVAFLGGR